MHDLYKMYAVDITLGTGFVVKNKCTPFLSNRIIINSL